MATNRGSKFGNESIALTHSNNQPGRAASEADTPPSMDVADAEGVDLSNATSRRAFHANMAALYRFPFPESWSRPPIPRLYAVSLLVIVGLLFLTMTIFNHVGVDSIGGMNGMDSVNNVDTYESVVTYVNDVTLCAGVTALCQIASASVQGSVHMVCWQDAVGITGKQNRWFYIQAPDGVEGFVHAAAVSNQIITPYCSKISWMNTTAWALNQDGQTVIPTTATDGTNLKYWSSSSWLFAYDAWKLGGGHTPVHSAATAQQTWNLYKENGAWSPAASAPPRGALVFFSYHNTGRVAVALGNGWVEIAKGADGLDGTDDSRILPVTHMTIDQVGLTELGYVPPNLV